MLPLLLLAAAALPPHPNSLSRTRLVVDAEGATVELRCQTLSVLEVLPQVDRDGNGLLDAPELEAGGEAIATYLGDHYQLFAPGHDGGEVELSSRLERARIAPPDPGQVFPMQWLELGLRYEGARAFDSLRVEVSLFQVTSPGHVDLAQVRFGEEEPFEHLFTGGQPSHVFDAARVRRAGVFGRFLELGVRHILGGYDHLCFLLALLVAATRLRSLVGVVTAFTLSHSVTLALASFGWHPLSSRTVELAIALSIAYVAAENLVVRKPRRLWIEAFLFGLLHGLGFAGFLADSLGGEPLKLTALLGFNLGVEAGQLGMVLLAALLLRLLPGSRAIEGADGEELGRWLAPRWSRGILSAAVVAAGLFWFAQRAWFS